MLSNEVANGSISVKAVMHSYALHYKDSDDDYGTWLI